MPLVRPASTNNLTMEILTNNFVPRPNEMVSSMYVGVASGNRTVTRIVKPSADRNHMEVTTTYGPGFARGQSGRVGVLVLGGMVTTLDEMAYIVQAKQEKRFVPRRTGGEIAQMCRLVQTQRNEQIEARQKFLKGNPSEAPKPKKKVRLLLPVGMRYVPTSEPGLKVLARV